MSSALRMTSPPQYPLRKRCIHLNFITVPLFSALLLLATGAIDGTVVREGIIGANGVKPIQIMALFISLVIQSLRFRIDASTTTPSFLGLLDHISGRDWTVPFPGILGCAEGRIVGPPFIWIPMGIFPVSRYNCWQCKPRKLSLRKAALDFAPRIP